MAKRNNWENVNKKNKCLSHGSCDISDELPVVGTYADMRRYCESRGVNTLLDDSFEYRFPMPKGKDEPHGPKIIVRKFDAVIRRQSDNQGVVNTSSDIEYSLQKSKDKPWAQRNIGRKAGLSTLTAMGDSGIQSNSKKTLGSPAKPYNPTPRIKQLEEELVRLVNFVSLVNVKKSSSGSCKKLLEEIYSILRELIKLDPVKAKSPLNPELQKAYDKLRTVVS